MSKPFYKTLPNNENEYEEWYDTAEPGVVVRKRFKNVFARNGLQTMPAGSEEVRDILNSPHQKARAAYLELKNPK
jgi:hypothetical protein